jgi:hypothetical protein
LRRLITACGGNRVETLPVLRPIEQDLPRRDRVHRAAIEADEDAEVGANAGRKIGRPATPGFEFADRFLVVRRDVGELYGTKPVTMSIAGAENSEHEAPRQPHHLLITARTRTGGATQSASREVAGLR